MTGEEVNKAEAGDKNIPDVGSLLSEARKSKGLDSLDYVARELCIRPHLLEALEQNNFSAFPTACYASGFLKSYATYLGLDAASVVSQFKSEYEGATEKVELVFPEVPPRAHLPRTIAASIGSLSLVIMLGVWMMFGSENISGDMLALEDLTGITLAQSTSEPVQAPNQEPVAETTELASVEQPVEDKAETGRKFTFVQQATAKTGEATRKDVMATAVVTDRIRLTADADIWVRISGPEGEILFDRVVQKGEEFFAPDRKGLTLMTSNASALSVFVGDVAISPLGDYGQIVSELALDQKKLLQKTALLQY
ncbi:helix-turn-helix domain-containing protein [Emcibacter nanhaiensis]|nr:helix-turn-helix domain-containing protein [Emcibacter nanhaiensis]